MSHTAIDATIKWLESCETETQLDTCKVWIFDTILCSDMERETLKDEYYRVVNQRSWVASKVRNLDDNLYQDCIKSGGLSNQLYSEPQPTDQCTH